jgi:hypothetical protein
VLRYYLNLIAHLSFVEHGRHNVERSYKHYALHMHAFSTCAHPYPAHPPIPMKTSITRRPNMHAVMAVNTLYSDMQTQRCPRDCTMIMMLKRVEIRTKNAVANEYANKKSNDLAVTGK